MNTLSRPYLFGLLAGLFLAAGLCLAALTVTHAWMKIAETNVINVTGSARKDVRSDLVIWNMLFTNVAKTLPAAQMNAKANLAEVLAFLKTAGLTDITVEPVVVNERYDRVKESDGTEKNIHAGYSITQRLKVHSTDVDMTPKLASDTAELIDKGIVLQTSGIQFIYTKAGEAKIEMMGEATRDARTRAEQIASQGGRKIKALRSARMGVVQINPRYSTATSWEGNNDTSALEKTITTTMTAVFSLE
ncbi:MAG: SIMPL domain-containing protein [Opitutaceae bacterium]|jgi:hypothetical protein|nr:SIMPL domain-containing protein [Opitutaceae bacterium]